MKEYSKLLAILCSWKYASSLSYFRRVYQQRKDCVLESLSEERKKELKYGIGRKVLQFAAAVRNCLILWTFYGHIKYIEVDVSWLLKVKAHLDKLERYGENLPFFKFKYDFNAFCYFKFPDFENLCILLTMNKGSGVFRTSSSSQVSQGEFAVRDFVKSEGEENKIISSAGNTPDIEENHGNSNMNNTAK